MTNDLNLTEVQQVELAHRIVCFYYKVETNDELDRRPLLNNPKVAFIKAHRCIAGTTLAESKEFAEGPGRFAVHELKIRVEERKKENGEGIYG